MDISIKTIQNLLFFSEIVAAFAATIFYYKYKKSTLKYILILLWLIVLNEQLATYMGRNRVWLFEGRYNYWIYNIMTPIKTLLILWVYVLSLKTRKYSLWIKRFVVSYTIVFFVNILFIQNFFTSAQSNSKILGATFIVLCTIFYFLELLRSEKIMVFHKQLLFWISIGLLIFYSGTIPITLAFSYYSHLSYIHSIYLINFILGIVMYLLFTFGFIWSKKE